MFRKMSVLETDLRKEICDKSAEIEGLRPYVSRCEQLKDQLARAEVSVLQQRCFRPPFACTRALHGRARHAFSRTHLCRR